MNIVLIGFASSGKTTVARALCARAGMRHVDLDGVMEDIYERERGERIVCRDIFKFLGVDGFMGMEHDALNSIIGLGGIVLSTGGRTPMNTDNHPPLKSFGKIVYLKCGVENIIKRMSSKGVPLSMGSTPEEIAAEWSRRDPVYQKLADIIVENDDLSPDETARVIMERI